MEKRTPEETAAFEAAEKLLHDGIKNVMNLESFRTLETVYDGKIENVDKDFDSQIKYLNKIRDKLKAGKKTIKIHGYLSRELDLISTDVSENVAIFQQNGPMYHVTIICDYENAGKLLPPICDNLEKKETL